MKPKTINLFFKAALLFSALFLFVGAGFETATAQVNMPADANVTSGTLSLYVGRVSSDAVNVHRITTSWTETAVTWNNFGGSYDAAIVNSFTPDSLGWHSVDVTSLVQDWFSGTPNYGLLIEQGENATYYSNYLSSDRASVNDRPKLEICYTSASSGDACVIIRRTGDAPGDVVDADIWTFNPDTNNGTADVLFTGFINGTEQSLLRFDFEVPPPPSGGGEGCSSRYWRQAQNFDSWPSPYTPDTLFATVFEDAFPDKTMLRALRQRGHGLKALGRHTTAALLNATSPDVDYDLTAAEVIQMFNDVYPGSRSDYNALINQFKAFNKQGCPLD